MFAIEDPAEIGALVRTSAEMFAAYGVSARVTGGLGPESAGRLERAIADGFRDAIALPSASWQHEHLQLLGEAFAHGVEWAAPHIDVDGAGPIGRPEGPYVVLLQPDGADDDLRGLTAPALRKRLDDDACLTVGEYLVIQRSLFDRYGDHRFDDYTGDPPGWMWLADSMVGDRTAMAYWYGPKRRIEVTACRTGSKNPRKGARRCRIVPLV